jgi:hypothetical protein
MTNLSIKFSNSCTLPSPSDSSDAYDGARRLADNRTTVGAQPS